MSVTVVAVLQAIPGRGKDVIEAFRQVSPLVHEEPGCELYATHLEQGGDTVVMVERWASQEDLDRHTTGPALVRLGGLIGDLLAKPFDVWLLDPVAMGDERKGVVPL